MRKKTVHLDELVGTWLSPAQFMAIIPMSRQSYNYMCREGQVKCKKFNGTWYVHISEVA